MKGDRGFVLINALLIVAALSAAAILLLARAQEGRTRLGLTQEWTQTEQYLDAFDALAITLLNRDGGASQIDTLDESWAKTTLNVELDRGRVAGRIHDLRGRFNVNRLTGAPDPTVAERFVRLAASAGLAEAQADAILTFLGTDGAPPPSGYGTGPIARHPRGASLISTTQLRAVTALSPQALEIVLPLLAAIPGGPVNVNTASASVLSAELPQGLDGVARDIVSQRQRAPFETTEDFLAFLDQNSDADLEQFDDNSFTVESDWFLVESAATLGATTLHRQTLIRRSGTPRRARVMYRLRIRE